MTACLYKADAKDVYTNIETKIHFQFEQDKDAIHFFEQFGLVTG